MIFPPIKLPQYIVVPPTDCEMNNIIGYHNKHLTGKISNYTTFLKNAGICYLLYICNNDSDLPLKIAKAYLTSGNRFVFSPNPLIISHLKIRP
jgi:hypothetical protein